ncbi:MAG: hypothetical protein H6741_12325 [Alphaproteobacteria bacterium]|nr:hypothetical protein [Alphaproteobacteria bacterium]MCB9793500.1 hypothetical protein [Alphaproteobacteria bacterium]
MDAGNLLYRSQRLPDSDRAQRLVKAELIAEAYALLGVDGMVFGEADLALGDDYWRIVEQHQLPLIATNLSCESRALPTQKVVERAGVKVGLLGLAPAAPEGCSLSEAQPAVEAAIAQMGDVDVLVLLSAERSDAERALAAKVADIDFVVHGGETLTNTQAAALEGGAWQLSAGDRGKKVGVATLDFTPGASAWYDEGATDALARRVETYEERIRKARADLEDAEEERARSRIERRIEVYERELQSAREAHDAAAAIAGGPRNLFANGLVELGDNIADHPATAALVAQGLLAVEQAAAQPQEGAAFASKAFVGSNFCQGCHPGPFAQWKTTPHADAYRALTKDRRNLDQDCWSCHVTGAFHPEGPQSPREVSGLKEVGCESCHGPGAAHIQDPAGAKMSAEVSATTCTQCHDGVRDEGRFELSEYLPKVAHGGE